MRDGTPSLALLPFPLALDLLRRTSLNPPTSGSFPSPPNLVRLPADFLRHSTFGTAHSQTRFYIVHRIALPLYVPLSFLYSLFPPILSPLHHHLNLPACPAAHPSSPLRPLFFTPLPPPFYPSLSLSSLARSLIFSLSSTVIARLLFVPLLHCYLLFSAPSLSYSLSARQSETRRGPREEMAERRRGY